MQYFLALALAALALSCSGVAGLKHPLTDMPEPLENVDTTFHFADHEDLKLPVGTPLTILCLVQNNEETAINVTGIMGSLNVAFAFQQHMQNFSYKSFGVVVKPDEEVTLQYDFEIYKEFDVSQEYSLAHTVFYDSEGGKRQMRYSTTFFNQTVEIYNTDSDFETESIFELVSIVVTTFVTALMVVAACLPDLEFVKSARKTVQSSKFFRAFTSTGYYGGGAEAAAGSSKKLQ